MIFNYENKQHIKPKMLMLEGIQEPVHINMINTESNQSNMSVHASSDADWAARLISHAFSKRGGVNQWMHTASFLAVVMSSYLLNNHGNKRALLFPIWVMHKYTLVKIISNYKANIVPNYLINISEHVVWTLIMNKLKL